MATYIEKHTAVTKDTINVDHNSRETFQHIRFMNPQNEYYGTMKSDSYRILDKTTGKSYEILVQDNHAALSGEDGEIKLVDFSQIKNELLYSTTNDPSFIPSMQLLSTLHDIYINSIVELNDSKASLSGGNEISGENTIEQLSSELIYANELSANQISAPSLNDILVDGQSLSSILQNIDTNVSYLSTQLSGEIDNLSSSLSNELSTLSSDIKEHYYTADETDKAINRVAAYYITNVDGKPFETYDALLNATEASALYSGGVLRYPPTRNDYTIVLSAGDSGNEEWRYIFTGDSEDDDLANKWQQQYPIETNDYAALDNKPKINNVELSSGNITLAQLSVVPESRKINDKTLSANVTLYGTDIKLNDGGRTILSAILSIENSLAGKQDALPLAKGASGKDAALRLVVSGDTQNQATADRAVALGYQTQATGNNSLTEGRATKASGQQSHAEGHTTIASGVNAHSEGFLTVAQNAAEHAQGRYNVSRKDSDTFGNAGNTHHSIGIGTSDSRQNAVEVMQNGDVYVKGVGGYGGTDSSLADKNTLQAVVNGKADVADLRYRIEEARYATTGAKLPDDVTVKLNGSEFAYEIVWNVLSSKWSLFDGIGALVTWYEDGSLESGAEIVTFWQGTTQIPAPNLLVPYALADRTVNLITTEGGQALIDIVFPASQEGYSRDFYLAVMCGSTAPTINKPSGVTLVNQNGEPPDLSLTQSATTVLRFTEVKEAGQATPAVFCVTGGANGGGSGAQMESMTHAELVALRSAGKLVPGQQYRITDYVATTNGDMDSSSAGHAFDIIVAADSTNTLNERARAIMHSGDTYFASCNLAAWDVWYCVDNDTVRFAWAATNGKGVVYRLVDEFGNDCPYDFKGIQFKAYGDTDNVWRYTFDSGDASNNTDLSKSRQNNIYGNKIRVYHSSGKQALNCIVFKGINCYYNTFESNCQYNTFGSDCRFNTFGAHCRFNTFGTRCQHNTFGLSCSYNTFGTDCRYDTFGTYCSYNTSESNFQYNTLGTHCQYNTFGTNCQYNTFGADCQYNTFGADCQYNTFGADCQYNTFGSLPDEYDPNNTYQAGDVCLYRGGVYVCNDGAEDVTGPFDSSKWHSDRAAASKSFYQYIEFEQGVQYVFLDCTATRSDYEYFQNMQVSIGVHGLAVGQSGYPEYKLIQDSNVSQEFKTTYKPANSKEISI